MARTASGQGNAHPVGLDTDGCVIWKDEDTGECYNSGEPPTKDEADELGRKNNVDSATQLNKDTNMKYNVKITVEGKRLSDVEMGIDEAKRWIMQEYTTGFDSNDDGNYNFDMTVDDSQPDED